MDWDLLSSYAGLLSLATISVYAGSVGSIPTSAHREKPDDGGANANDADDDESDITDRLGAEDAWMFPVIGSVALFGLYLVVTYLGKEWINWFLGWYFALAGVGSMWKTSISLVRWTMGLQRWKTFDKIKFTVSKGSAGTQAVFRTPSLVLLPLGALPSALYTFHQASRKSAVLTDILALSFSHNALSLLKIDSFRTGCILLSGLFLYDIWWVFGTEVMVKVATNLDVPIKILWPKSLLLSTEHGFTMLGLGDIVIPGTFIALALRYDFHRHHATTPLRGGSFAKPYFWAALFAYFSGLVTTMTVMHVFKAAQPALLYLSPACMLSFVITATVRGELKEAWAWSDDPEKAKEEKAKEEAAAALLDATDVDAKAAHPEKAHTEHVHTPGGEPCLIHEHDATS